MFLGPKPKLAHFWLICLLDYITLIDKNFDPKTHPSWPLDLKNEKKRIFFKRPQLLEVITKSFAIWLIYTKQYKE